MSVHDKSIEELLAEAAGTAPKRTPAAPETSVPTMTGIHPTEDHHLEGALVTAVTEAIQRVLRERRLR